MKRFIKIENSKLKSLINSKEELANKVQDVTKEITDLEEKRNKLVLKIQRYDDKARPLIEEYRDEKELNEFESYHRIYMADDEVRLEILDHLEEFKEWYKAQQEELKKKQNASESVDKNEGDNR